MANEKVSQLPSVTSASNDDIVMAIQAGVSVQETLEQISDLIFGNIVFSYAGNPNGNVAGDFKNLLWDSSNNKLWVCSAPGTSSTAVWKATITATGLTGILPVANGGTNASVAGIAAFNNITGYTAAGATGTTSTNIVFSTSPTLVTPILGAASATSLSFSTTAGIIGTTTNNSAASGSVGEYISNTLASGGAVVSLTNNTAADVLTISLTAGDWDVGGLVGFKFDSGVTTYTNLEGWISTTSVTAPNDYLIAQNSSSALTSAGLVSFCVPEQRISIAGTTTVYLSVKASFAVSTTAGYGYIYARRIR